MNASEERPLALALGGGGARAAYQVGVLRGIASQFPDLQPRLLSGVSAGAINTAHLACFEGRFVDSLSALTDLWCGLQIHDVIRTDALPLISRVVRIGLQLSLGTPPGLRPVHGMVDTQPLRTFLHRALSTADGSLPAIDRNLARGRLQGVALTTSSYATGETVTFFSGRRISEWERPGRRSTETSLTIEHIMASSALPLVFPPVRLGNQWYGDGGVRLHAPLAPAVHMGASRLLVISTHFNDSAERPSSDRPDLPPSPATVLAEIYNSMFLDQLDQDVRHMERINRLLRLLPTDAPTELRPVDLVVIRPSRDIGSLAWELRDRLPRTLRFLLQRLGGGQDTSDDFLSTLLFHPDYIRQLIEIGQQDAQHHLDQIARLIT